MVRVVILAIALLVGACGADTNGNNSSGSDVGTGDVDAGTSGNTNGGTTAGCFAAGTCNDDVDAACQRMVQNFNDCIEIRYADDPDTLAQERATKANSCDSTSGVFDDRAAGFFHCQADAFGAGECSTNEQYYETVGEAQKC